MTDDSKLILIRNKQDENGNVSVQLVRENEVDLTDFRVFRIHENGREDYCHKDEYEIYKKVYNKVDNKDD